MQEDDLGNYDDELEESHDMMEEGLFGQEEELEEGEEAREGETRALPKGHSAEQMRIHRHTRHPSQELVSTVRGWKSQELASLQARSG